MSWAPGGAAPVFPGSQVTWLGLKLCNHRGVGTMVSRGGRSKGKPSLPGMGNPPSLLLEAGAYLEYRGCVPRLLGTTLQGGGGEVERTARYELEPCSRRQGSHEVRGDIASNLGTSPDCTIRVSTRSLLYTRWSTHACRTA